MTVSDLLNVIVFDAGDNSSDFRTNTRRWLNAVRAEVADAALWRQAVTIDASFNTSSATTDGLYALQDTSGNKYEHLLSDWLYNETSDERIVHESQQQLDAIDAAKDVTGPPTYWGDAGVDTNSIRQIYLWPVPDGTYTIRFSGIKRLTDLTDGDESLSDDPYFGEITPWANCFLEGLRYWYDKNNNEDAAKIAAQYQLFQRSIRKRKTRNNIAVVTGLPLRVVRTSNKVATGRFDPSHYSNR